MFQPPRHSRAIHCSAADAVPPFAAMHGKSASRRFALLFLAIAASVDGRPRLEDKNNGDGDRPTKQRGGVRKNEVERGTSGRSTTTSDVCDEERRHKARDDERR